MKKSLAFLLFFSLLFIRCTQLINEPNLQINNSVRADKSLQKIVQPNTITFTNPLGDGCDPYIVKAGNRYWKCGSTGSAIYVHNGTDVLTNANSTSATCVFTPPQGTMFSSNLWAPELHYLSGRWYIYFCADDGNDANHRMFVLEGGTDAENPLNGTFLFKTKLTATDSDYFGIDGHPFVFGNQLYYVWSGWPGNTSGTQRIYIAKMSNPFTISSNRVEISRPDYSWEMQGSLTINEGPHALICGSTVNIIYSASCSWLNDYCLGCLTCTNSNLLDKSNWTKSGPVFYQTTNVWGPGHASFVTSLDNRQNWIIYHGAKYNGAGWDRDVRMQQFTWHNNTPYFGKPIDPGVILAGASKGEVPLYNGLYKVTVKCSGKCLDVPSGVATPGTVIQQWPDNGAIAQRWIFTDMNDGYYKITSQCNNLCLDNAGSSINAGSKIIQWTDNGADAQRWRIENTGNGYFRLINKYSLLALDMPSMNDGTQFQQWTLNNFDAQRYKIEIQAPIQNGTYKVTSKFSNKCLDVPSGTATLGTIIQQWPDNGAIAQRWVFTYIGDGYFKITSKCNNLCLDNAGSSLTPGTKIIQWTDNGADAQIWRIEPFDNGYYRIINKASQLAMDISVIGDGAQFQQWTPNFFDFQLFKIELQP